MGGGGKCAPLEKHFPRGVHELHVRQWSALPTPTSVSKLQKTNFPGKKERRTEMMMKKWKKNGRKMSNFCGKETTKQRKKEEEKRLDID